MSATIEQTILNYNKQVDDALEQIKVIHSKYVCANPEDLRNYYDRTTEIIEKKTIEINERKDYINKCINDLENWKKTIEKMENVLIEIGQTSNRGRVGTLHGLCKQTIKENNISMDEIEQMVFGFHDEKMK